MRIINIIQLKDNKIQTIDSYPIYDENWGVDYLSYTAETFIEKITEFYPEVRYVKDNYISDGYFSDDDGNELYLKFSDYVSDKFDTSNNDDGSYISNY
jgi:hypothetical protein